VNGPPRDWLPTVMLLLQREPAVVRVVVAEARGSVPREPGAFMLVSRGGVEGTVGGGRLEWECIAAARELLDDASVSVRLNKIVLAADVGQCCGGVVSVWLDRFSHGDLGMLALARDAAARGAAILSSTIRGAGVEREILCGEQTKLHGSARPRVLRGTAGEVTFLERLDDVLPALWLYGAGHVGQALARIAAELPLRFTWVDSRPELFPTVPAAGVRFRGDADSVATVADAPPGACFLVMTHSHPLDYELCRAILRRNDFAWLGLIGSESKAARFRSRLAREGIAADRIARLVCPIGVPGIGSKWPAAIAVGVAAQLLQVMSAAMTAEGEMVRSLGRKASLEALPSPDCGQESCSTCGTRQRPPG